MCRCEYKGSTEYVEVWQSSVQNHMGKCYSLLKWHIHRVVVWAHCWSTQNNMVDIALLILFCWCEGAQWLKLPIHSQQRLTWHWSELLFILRKRQTAVSLPAVSGSMAFCTVHGYGWCWRLVLQWRHQIAKACPVSCFLSSFRWLRGVSARYTYSTVESWSCWSRYRTVFVVLKI